MLTKKSAFIPSNLFPLHASPLRAIVYELEAYGASGQ